MTQEQLDAIKARDTNYAIAALEKWVDEHGHMPGIGWLTKAILIAVQTMQEDAPALIADVEQLQAVKYEVEMLNSRVDAQMRRMKHLERITRWISIEDRLPENGEYVLAALSHGVVRIASYWSTKGWVALCVTGLSVTHWMPLPQPPNDEPLFDEQKCRVCGCTWDNACEGGSYWVEDDLCSKCAETLQQEEAADDPQP